jgi:hypothetical protein
MPDIVLATLNARYSHTSLGLRCLRANLGDLRARSSLREYTIKRPALEIVADILSQEPRIIGFGVYIWNVSESARVIAMIKTLKPEVVIVLGGPEVSHETDGQEITRLADYVIRGPGEHAFAQLCARILHGERPDRPWIDAAPVPLESLRLPYDEYTDEDIDKRMIYVEASRGCPFKCEFCLSALDKTAKPFGLERFLNAIDRLHKRGARRFKFVDRTFNLDMRTATRILAFFLERLDDRLFLHFEIIPDHLPDALKEFITRFPKGSLQFEIGVQSFNPETQALISRRQDNARTEANLRWLREHSQAHLHTDLIVGLPGEDMASFGRGFDRLVYLAVHEIQVGMLKRLRGAPIARHAVAHDLRFNPSPPYEILATNLIGFADMLRLTRFARYWDIVGNSGRFPRTLPVLLGDAPFARFMAFADWLYDETGQTHELALDRLWRLLHGYLTEVRAESPELVRAALAVDFGNSGTLGVPAFLRAGPQRQ